jgi:hypothetical protein
MIAYSQEEINKNYINKKFGFAFNKIVLLESSANPYDYVMFRVCGLEYKVNNGKLTILTI